MDSKTVYIIGAGASKEVGLPTGNELKNEISNLLDIRYDYVKQISGDSLIREALDKLTSNTDPLLKAARHIRDAMPQAISIDNFIDTHRDNKNIAICGKLAIIRAILSAEQNSSLYFKKTRVDSTIDFNALTNTWYIPFFQLLTENCATNNLEERLESIVLIIFNYDRCIEHFLYHALQNYYKLSESESAQLIRKINIYHPYGSVGALPWTSNTNSMSFGDSPYSEQLLKLIEQIKTFTEGTDPDSSDISSIKEHMTTADRLVFLGFAFHKLNMQLIAPQKSSVWPKLNCYATILGISIYDEDIVSSQIDSLYSNTTIYTKLINCHCSKFFNELWRSLAF